MSTMPHAIGAGLVVPEGEQGLGIEAEAGHQASKEALACRSAISCRQVPRSSRAGAEQLIGALCNGSDPSTPARSKLPRLHSLRPLANDKLF